jgi:hypothetical protein
VTDEGLNRDIYLSEGTTTRRRERSVESQKHQNNIKKREEMRMMARIKMRKGGIFSVIFFLSASNDNNDGRHK